MAKIAADDEATLDYVEFRNSSPNNCDVFICCHGVAERVGCCTLDQISANLAAEDSFSEGCHAKFRLHLPKDPECAAWFSKSTVLRFLKITESAEALNTIVAFANEMSQLQDTRKFHVSLYGQAENGTISSEDSNSKNELLRAMDSRLAALSGELTSAFDRAAGEACSQEEIDNLNKFCEHFGSTSLRNTLCKLSESCRDGNFHSTLDKHVKYDASSIKASHIEHQSSTTESSENSSNNSDEEEDGERSIERSRTRTRSATPRRSASPMRRIQIGKSGSRRTPAIAVKSLSYFPGRDKVFATRDIAQNDDDEDRGFGKIPESNVRRMSVQDAISLFERKQKDQSIEVQRKTPQLDNPPVKSVVLRRWSSGMGESSAKLPQQRIPSIKVEEESNNRSVEEEQETSDVVTGVQSEVCPVVSSLPESGRVIETGTELERADVVDSLPLDQNVVGENERMDSVEWNRQKEEELKQLLTSFALTQPTSSKNQKTDTPEGKAEEVSYDQKKNKRSQRPQQVEKAGTKKVREAPNKTEKQEAASRVVRKLTVKTTKLDLSSSTNGSVDVKKKQVASRTTQKDRTVLERLPFSLNVKPEPARALAQNAPPNKSSATRKSLPSTPSPRGNSGKVVAKKTPPPDMTTASGGTKSFRQKSQLSASSLTDSTPPRAETLKSLRKEARKDQVNNNKSSITARGDSPRVLPKSVKSRQPDILILDEEKPSTRGVRSGLRTKATKRSTVVPLESKSSSDTQKVTAAASPAKSPSPKRKGTPSPVKKPLNKSATPAKEPLTRNETLLLDEDGKVTRNETLLLDEDGKVTRNETLPLDEAGKVTNPSASEPSDQKVVEGEPEGHETYNHVDLELEPPAEPFTACEDLEEMPSQTIPENDHVEDTTERTESTTAELNQEEVPIISPTVWVENGHEQDLATVSSSESASQVDSSSHDDAGSRVRHSLSHMLLLEEMSDPDDTAEWGHAENSSSAIVQKAAPKGLKKLLKFAKKNKGGEAHLTDSLKREDGKIIERSNPSNSSFESSSCVTSKASRSFFSLSAFRGTKTTTDSKMRWHG